jgi:zinc D-Ala-D-Ala carboxypeptidase
MHLLRALAAAVMLAGGLLIVPAAAPSPVAGVGPLPPCELLDVLTAPRGYDDWATTLVDWNLTLGSDYKPPDLVSVRNGGVGGGGYVRKVVIDDLKAMATAASKNGTPLVAWSPYRSYKQQKTLFNGYAGWNSTTQKYSNYDSAIQFSARPGHSEHQTGLTIDFVAVGDKGLTSNWEATKTGAWMAKHAWEYGWLMSYPKGKQDVVCYSYEPWHYRYLGRDLAKKIHDSGLTIREYLWANFTQLTTTFQPVGTATPVPSLPAGPTPSAPGADGSPEASATAPTGTSDPPATSVPSSAAGTVLGLDAPVVLAVILLVIAAAGLAFSLRRARSSRRAS